MEAMEKVEDATKWKMRRVEVSREKERLNHRGHVTKLGARAETEKSKGDESVAEP